MSGPRHSSAATRRHGPRCDRRRETWHEMHSTPAGRRPHHRRTRVDAPARYHAPSVTTFRQPAMTSTSTSTSSADQPAADSLTELRDRIRLFTGERDWDQFHTPKNLAMALSVEVAELAEHFQWLATGADAELDDAKRTGIRHELADVLVYLIQLADKCQVDLREAVLEKMLLNAAKYPAAQVKGDARKYNEY